MLNNNNIINNQKQQFVSSCRLLAPGVTSAKAIFSSLSSLSSSLSSTTTSSVRSCSDVHKIAKIGELNSLTFSSSPPVKWFSLLEERENSNRCSLSWQQQQQVSRNLVRENIFVFDLRVPTSGRTDPTGNELNFESLLLQPVEEKKCLFKRVSPSMQEIAATKNREFSIQMSSISSRSDDDEEKICRGLIHVDYAFHLRIRLEDIKDEGKKEF